MTVARSLLCASVVGMSGLGEGLENGMPVRVECGRMMAKALPSLEGGERVIYFQASTETRDWQGERILAKALEGSIPYFLRHGRIDLDHASVVDPRTNQPATPDVRGRAITDPYLFEIGKPVDARPGADGLIQVKARIFKGDTSNPWTAMADVFWGSLQADPVPDWYPSVQGLVHNEAGVVADGLPTQEIRGMLWQSVGLSRTPVSRDVPAVTTVPLRVFAKALGSSLGIAKVLAELQGQIPPAPAVDAPGELSQDQLIQVLEGLTQAPKGLPPAEFLQQQEAAGIPQTHSLAVLMALLGS